MARATLTIRSHRQNAKGKSSIFVRYSHKDRSCFFATGVVVDKRFWDSREEVLRKSLPSYTSLNAVLGKRKLEITEIQLRLQLQDIEPTIDAVRSEYQRKYKPVEKEPEVIKYLMDYWDEFITYQEEVENLNRSTLAQYESTKKLLIEFEKYLGVKWQVNDLNQELGERLVVYQFKIKNLSNNTVGSRIKMLRKFMNHLISKKVLSDNSMKNVKRPSNKTDFVTLTIEQINQLMDLDLSKNQKLDKIRDLYCFNSNIGLRFSDLNGLTLANIKSNHVVVTTRKTNTFVRIPLNAIARKILLKYPDGLPKISNVKFNKYIKEVGGLAKFDMEYEIHKWQGGERKKILVPLKELMNSHQCRRNFCSNCLRLKLPPLIIQRLTGHADYRTFAKYLYASDEHIGEEFNKAWDDAMSK